MTETHIRGYNGETERDRSTESTESTAEEAESTEERTTTCPECEGNLITDTEHGETVCSECGLVVEQDSVDRGPEWRAFDSSERDSKSRVGAPTTNMMHDKGLSTNIGWQDKDAYGKSLSSRQRQRMQRLRTWNERFRTRDSKERNLKQALGEIDRMASALGLPDNVRETASVIYRRALSENLLPGRSIEGVATAALYAAARQAGNPRSLDEISAVSRVDKMELTRTYRYVIRELKLEIQPADPGSYVPGSSRASASPRKHSGSPANCSTVPNAPGSPAGNRRSDSQPLRCTRLPLEREGNPEPGVGGCRHLRSYHPEPVQGTPRCE